VQDFVCPRCAGLSAGNIQYSDDSIQLKWGTIKEIKSFCYLEDILQCEGGAERAARARVSQAWLRWREISCLLCNINVPIKRRAFV